MQWFVTTSKLLVGCLVFQTCPLQIKGMDLNHLHAAVDLAELTWMTFTEWNRCCPGCCRIEFRMQCIIHWFYSFIGQNTMNKKRSDISFTSRLYVMLCIYIYICPMSTCQHLWIMLCFRNDFFSLRWSAWFPALKISGEVPGFRHQRSQVKCLVSCTEDLTCFFLTWWWVWW
jgi:hypothetical protein